MIFYCNKPGTTILCKQEQYVHAVYIIKDNNLTLTNYKIQIPGRQVHYLPCNQQ